MLIHNSKDIKKWIRARLNASLCCWINKGPNPSNWIKPIEFFIPSSCQKDDQELYAAQLFIKRVTIREGIDYEFIQFLKSLNYFCGSNQWEKLTLYRTFLTSVARVSLDCTLSLYPQLGYRICSVQNVWAAGMALTKLPAGIFGKSLYERPKGIFRCFYCTFDSTTLGPWLCFFPLSFSNPTLISSFCMSVPVILLMPLDSKLTHLYKWLPDLYLQSYISNLHS